MLEEILVIRESIPIFYYNKDPDKALSDNYYVLQSGFFVALTHFANEMSNDKLRYVVLENKLYALDEVSDVLLIFGQKEKLSAEVLSSVKEDLKKAANYLNQLFKKYQLKTAPNPSIDVIDKVAYAFGEYLKEINLVEDDRPFDPKESRSMMQKFIFNAIGYKAGQCNIGKAERQKRLIMGIISFAIAIIGAMTIFFIPTINAYYGFLLMLPIAMGFFGLFQYFFKFCAINGLTKKYDMH
ncbi:MAG: hypothetical protein K9W42_10080 [Candidatus Heimdallarchaeota archaeon]|nr:hypothetical protein [Candidatus Heimdallarchaeota archaeon]